ncbi:MAG: hypothetical protein ABSH38_16585 [Verrucomicrobiota bacterium]|jgi:hypothetical protein
MKQVDTALIEAETEAVPHLHVVATPNGAAKKDLPPAPFVLPSRLRNGHARPELAALGWESRGQRLTAAK